MISDPYKVLGVSSTDSKEEITKAYRQMAKKYHPDLNQGDEEAAKKMSEVNAAYEQIKSGKTPQNGSGGGYSSQSSYGNGNSSSEGYDPFAGFNPFAGFGGQQQQRREPSEFDSVNSYLRAGYYKEALNVLESITNRNAQWYYYSALANYNIDNKITALHHAKTAVQMEPNNFEYQRILSQIQGGGRMYQQQSQDFGIPINGLYKLCLGICFAKLFCGC